MNELTTTGLSLEDIELIKATVAKDATDGELRLFLHRCKVMGLDPLKPGQIHFMKYKDKSGKWSPGTIVVGIDGFRSRAMATGKHRGTHREIVRDKNGRAVAAWCEVHREGWTHPAREEVSMAEYNSGRSIWQKMPETMLKKVAEAAALRMAFPDELGGVYAQEEMDQAGDPPPPSPRDVNPTPEPAPAPTPTPRVTAPAPTPAPVASEDQQLLQLRRAVSAAIKARGIDPSEVRAYVQAVHNVGPSESLNVKQASDLLELLQDETTTVEKLRYLATPTPPEEDVDDIDRALQQPEPPPLTPPMGKIVRVSDIARAQTVSPDGQPYVSADRVEEVKAYGRGLGYTDDEMTAVLQRRLHHTNWDRLVSFNLNILRNAFNAGDGKGK